MSTRLRKALVSALVMAVLMAAVLALLDALTEPRWWVFLLAGALVSFLSQYYLWGRHEE